MRTGIASAIKRRNISSIFSNEIFETKMVHHKLNGAMGAHNFVPNYWGGGEKEMLLELLS